MAAPPSGCSPPRQPSSSRGSVMRNASDRRSPKGSVQRANLLPCAPRPPTCSSNASVKAAAADFLDHHAVVEVTFAGAQASLQHIGVHRAQREVEAGLARLCEDQM